MTKPVPTYEALEQRKKNLETLLGAQKEMILLDMEELKEEVSPLINVFSTFTDFITRDKKAWLLGIGANALIDTLVRNILLSRSGRIARLIIPFFIKNYSSHYIARHQDEWIRQLKNLVTGHPGNGQAEYEHEPGH